MLPRRFRHLPILMLALATVLAAVGCGAAGGARGGDDTSEMAGSAGMSGMSAAGRAATGEGGTATLTVDGETTTIAIDPCYLLVTDRESLDISGGDGLVVMLPPEPGAFADDDFGSVILPPPPDDEYRPTGDIHGQWSEDGDRASGHVEGVAHLLSGIGGDQDPDIDFTLDFDCALQDITGG